jgi:hypothetical protein
MATPPFLDQAEPGGRTDSSRTDQAPGRRSNRRLEFEHPPGWTAVPGKAILPCPVAKNAGRRRASDGAFKQHSWRLIYAA